MIKYVFFYLIGVSLIVLGIAAEVAWLGLCFGSVVLGLVLLLFAPRILLLPLTFIGGAGLAIIGATKVVQDERHPANDVITLNQDSYSQKHESLQIPDQTAINHDEVIDDSYEENPFSPMLRNARDVFETSSTNLKNNPLDYDMNLELMALGYTMRLASACLYLRCELDDDDYEQSLDVFKGIQSETIASAEFQEEAFDEALLSFIYKYHSPMNVDLYHQITAEADELHKL